jgi:hypothetical protein
MSRKRYDTNIFTTQHNHRQSAMIINRTVERFYDLVKDVLEETCESKEEALDFIKFLEEHRSDVLPLPSSVKYMLESFIEMNEENVDEEGRWI